VDLSGRELLHVIVTAVWCYVFSSSDFASFSSIVLRSVLCHYHISPPVIMFLPLPSIISRILGRVTCKNTALQLIVSCINKSEDL
jgi:hypothetical protein